ncbi:polysaccharide deacetylase family protein [Desulfuribacillus alkaliarsenatis]|uniref:Chitooligosaccharide deacetylase n=1 Tax=Desulfuribacillus alkaliarsenatis TaxID=766136 RepID=A0A1E5G0D4_9FIRM|nr:polysaccharide deacetylase family protein [Desulfuribacillus alkaliarsenatis]OEF96282.1 chitooligosaccharide deacetylase [Desulfuribacillus alkaliarsenatis]
MRYKLGNVTIFVVIFLLAIIIISNPFSNEIAIGPQPIDGSEYSERVQRPVSNFLLQRQFPNTMVLTGSLLDDKIALTFDDGPDPRFTPLILDVLKQYNARATFFVMGSRAVAYPDIIRRMENEGHVIGNHTYWHPNLVRHEVERTRWEVLETEKVLNDILGYRPRLFRAPYGALNTDVVQELARQDFSVVGWSVDSLDWRQLPADEIARNVLGNVHPGAIVLFHDGGDWTMDLTGTVNSLHEIIPVLQQEGMSFVTVPELINISKRK